MRITQQTMYTSMLYGMNSTLSDLMTSNLQSATQKAINKPSDNPAGMAHILTYRDSLSITAQYETNTDTAEGWLTAAMGILDQTSTTIARIEELAEQAASGSYTAEEREIISEEVRELMGSLLNLANSRHEANSSSIFAGQNYTESAFDMGLGVTAQDPGLDTTSTGPGIGTEITAVGEINEDTIIRFPTGQNGGAATVTIPPAVDANFEWTEDGGKTWKTGTVLAGESTFTLGDATLTVPAGQTATITTSANDALITDTTSTQIHLKSAEVVFQVEGSLDNTAMVRFPEQDPALNPIRIPQNAATGADITYEWTEDGGETWNTGTIKAGDESFQVGAAIVSVPEGKSTLVSPYDPTKPPNTGSDETNGTELYVRPTAIYNGYDDNAEPVVDRYGTVLIPSSISSNVTGSLDKDVLVQFPDGIDMSVSTPPDNEHEYKYSTDGGQTWTTATTEVLPLDNGAPGDTTMRLVIAGGYMDMDYDAVLPDGTISDNLIPPAAQVIVKPQRTELEYEIFENEYMTVTNVGKDIFGGLYQPNNSNSLEAMYDGDERNLFETVGKLIGYLETNNQEGIGDCVEDLKVSHKTVTSSAAQIAGKVNRIEINIQMLSSQTLNQTARLSAIEDVNVAELTVKLTQQKTAYNAVLQSSSQIMQMSLLNYM